MTDWRSSKWGDEVVLEYGKALRSYSDKYGAYRVFGSNGPIGWTNEPLVHGPGVILGRKGAYRGVRFSPEPFFVIDTAYYVRPKTDHLDLRWLYYAIIYHRLGEIDDGSPIPSTTRAAVYVRDIEVPSPDEQRAIASILGIIDDKIELNHRTNETLEAMARAIFKDWFVDFGPTRAKMEGRAPYLTQEIWTLFPDRLDNERKPAEWQTKRWGEIVSEYGKGITGYEGQAGSYPVFGTNGQIGSHSQALCEHPGIIIGRKGAYRGVHYCERPFFVIDTAFYVEPRKYPIELRWAYYELLRQGINDMDSGSAIPSTSREEVYGLAVVFPPFTVQQSFVKLLRPIWDRQEHNRDEARTLAALRDALLPKLMSREIRVRDADRVLEAAL